MFFLRVLVPPSIGSCAYKSSAVYYTHPSQTSLPLAVESRHPVIINHARQSFTGCVCAFRPTDERFGVSCFSSKRATTFREILSRILREISKKTVQEISDERSDTVPRESTENNPWIDVASTAPGQKTNENVDMNVPRERSERRSKNVLWKDASSTEPRRNLYNNENKMTTIQTLKNASFGNFPPTMPALRPRKLDKTTTTTTNCSLNENKERKKINRQTTSKTAAFLVLASNKKLQ